MLKKTIYLNAGHSTYQPGAEIMGNKYETESELNMVIRDALVPELINNGFKVASVPDDKDIAESTKWVNGFALKVNDGLALSIHNNCCGGEGAECYYYKWSLSSAQKAWKLIDAYCEETGQNKRGAKSDTTTTYEKLGWIRRTNCWALLIETGFIDNANDMNLMDNIERVARGLARGVCAVYGIEYEPLTVESAPMNREDIKKQIVELLNKL